MKENKFIVWGIYTFSFIVFFLVILLHDLPKSDAAPSFTKFQPMLHAIINGTCFILLLTSLMAVKNKKIDLHKKLNTTAMLLSVFFLLSYVCYHYFAPETKYLGNYKSFYFFILITHILLAATSLPFILLSYYRGLIGNVEKHKKLVRYTYPIWVYVTFTGVLVYLFLLPYYGQ